MTTKTTEAKGAKTLAQELRASADRGSEYMPLIVLDRMRRAAELIEAQAECVETLRDELRSGGLLADQMNGGLSEAGRLAVWYRLTAGLSKLSALERA